MCRVSVRSVGQCTWQGPGVVLLWRQGPAAAGSSSSRRRPRLPTAGAGHVQAGRWVGVIWGVITSCLSGVWGQRRGASRTRRIGRWSGNVSWVLILLTPFLRLTFFIPLHILTISTLPLSPLTLLPPSPPPLTPSQSPSPPSSPPPPSPFLIMFSKYPASPPPPSLTH